MLRDGAERWTALPPASNDLGTLMPAESLGPVESLARSLGWDWLLDRVIGRVAEVERSTLASTRREITRSVLAPARVDDDERARCVV